uniref:Eukaryotic translation initiation factor 3 subunit G N-terminal domain-containing protein n=1 Tax=Tanacetum cinerariifolium TaxID=118510 RepID=A0A699GMC1_TANCI|nr:hypothetical protein [Tanacetum cinerariifolium]
MTRSLNKELIEPYDEPEQVLHSLRKLFKTTSFDHSSSSEFELFSDHKRQFEEEIIKTMTEPTMEEYMMRTQEDYGSGVARPKFDKDTRFELKGQFLKELREHTFNGSKNKDANEHFERVLELVDLFTTPYVTRDQLMLHVFLITLTGAEVILLYKGLDVPTRQILDSKGARTSTINKSSNTSDGLAAIQVQLNNLGMEFKKVNERVYATQVGCELCNGPHYTKDCPLKGEGKTLKDAYYTQFGVPFLQAEKYRAAALGFYQRDNGNTSYQERRQMMEELLSKFMAEYVKIHDEHSSLIKEIRASMDAAIRNQGSITTTKEVETLKEDEKIPLIELIQATIPFPESATSSRRLLKEKSRIDEDIRATMKVCCLEIIKDALPSKEKYPGSFTLPYSINNLCFDKALNDLGASVSVMPYSTFTNLGLELNDHEMEDLDHEIEEGEIIDELKNMNAYRDKDMGDVIVGKPFCRVVCVEAKRFDGFITIHDVDNGEVADRIDGIDDIRELMLSAKLMWIADHRLFNEGPDQNMVSRVKP